MDYLNQFLISSARVLKNLSEFFSSLTLIDVIFFFSVILLMILVVILLYFIKVNEDVYEKEDDKEDLSNNITDEILVSDLNQASANKKDFVDEGELIDLTSISKALENLDNNNVDLTAFEEEQEKEAIISYDELINKTKPGSINYKNETMLDDLLVKEVDLEHFNNVVENNEESISDKKVISYSQEEAFLEALKNLQKQIS